MTNINKTYTMVQKRRKRCKGWWDWNDLMKAALPKEKKKKLPPWPRFFCFHVLWRRSGLFKQRRREDGDGTGLHGNSITNTKSRWLCRSHPQPPEVKLNKIKWVSPVFCRFKKQFGVGFLKNVKRHYFSIHKLDKQSHRKRKKVSHLSRRHQKTTKQTNKKKGVACLRQKGGATSLYWVFSAVLTVFIHECLAAQFSQDRWQWLVINWYP